MVCSPYKTFLRYTIRVYLCTAPYADQTVHTMRFAHFLFLFLATAPLCAQQLEHHDILLFSYTFSADSTLQLSAPRFLTAFNPKGYNNQPCFMGPGELYVTVQLPNDTTQTDIYSLNLTNSTRSRVTATPTAEYSALPMPGGRRFSAVRVEEDGAQRLWSFPLDRSDNGRPEFPRIEGVGYHSWVNDTLAALFIVGENGVPHVLYTAGVQSQTLQRVAGSIGRSLQGLPGNRLAYVQKATEQTWYLKIWDLKKRDSAILVKMPEGCEDFAVTPDGTFLCGKGTKLYQYRPGRNSDWKEVADLARYRGRSISRLAFSRDGKLAVVVQ